MNQPKRPNSLFLPFLVLTSCPFFGVTYTHFTFPHLKSPYKYYPHRSPLPIPCSQIKNNSAIRSPFQFLHFFKIPTLVYSYSFLGYGSIEHQCCCFGFGSCGHFGRDSIRSGLQHRPYSYSRCRSRVLFARVHCFDCRISAPLCFCSVQTLKDC